MPIDAKGLRMLLSVPVLTVKVQEWGVVVPVGTKESARVPVVSHGLWEDVALWDELVFLCSQQQMICRVSKN